MLRKWEVYVMYFRTVDFKTCPIFPSRKACLFLRRKHGEIFSQPLPCPGEHEPRPEPSGMSTELGASDVLHFLPMSLPAGVSIVQMPVMYCTSCQDLTLC